MASLPLSVFKMVFERSTAGGYLLSPTPEFRILAVNDAFLAATGRRRAELLGVPLFEAFGASPGDEAGVQALQASLLRVLASGQPDMLAVQRYPIPVTGADGTTRFEERFWSALNTPIQGPDGALACISHSTIDVTDLMHLRSQARQQADEVARVRAEAALVHRAQLLQEVNRALEAEQVRLAHLFEHAPGFVYFTEGTQHRIVQANRALSTLAGPRQLVDRTIAQAFPEEGAQAFRQLHDEVLRSGAPRIASAHPLALRDAAGATRALVVDLALQPILDAQQRVVGICAQGHDITERQAAQARLAELNATLESQVRQRTAELALVSARERAIVASAGAAVITTDLEGRITSFNPAAEVLMRRPAARAIGGLITDFCEPGELRYKAQFFPAEVRENAARLPAQLLQGLLPEHARPGEGPRNTWTYVRDDGTCFPGLLSFSVLRDEQDQAIGFLAVIADLTDRQAMEQALRQRTAELEALQQQLRERTRQAEAANAAKTAFLANMSHEIRTPLNAVLGLSQLLTLMELPARAQEYVGHVQQAGEQLLGLVNDILDLSKIEAGEMELEAAAFELPQLLHQVSTLSQTLADRKGLQLRVGHEPDVPPRLYGDALRIRQVLANLLSNAVKFTEQGNVSLWVRLVSLHEAQLRQGPWAELSFEVQDTGIGIAPQQQAAIFQPFTQADASTTRRFGGTGLGLSIVQRLVGMMNGRLEMESELGRGSTFRVRLTLLVES